MYPDAFEQQAETKLAPCSSFKKPIFLIMQRTLLLKFCQFLSAEKYPKRYL